MKNIEIGLKLRPFIKTMMLALASIGCLAGQSQSFTQQQIENKVAVQYYRWFQGFEQELNAFRISNQLEIVSEDVRITTVQGSMQRHEGLKNFMEHVKSWKNAHHVRQMEVKSLGNDSLVMEADIQYENILPDGSQNTFLLHYRTKLAVVSKDLPVFTEIELLPVETIEEPVFVDAYGENRGKSLVYYWFSLVDDLDRRNESFTEVLAPEFDIRLGPNPIHDMDSWVTWLNTIQGNLSESLHFCENIQSLENADGTLTIGFDVVWQGIDKSSNKFKGKFHQDWQVKNDPDERFGRIASIQLQEIEAIHSVDSF